MTLEQDMADASPTKHFFVSMLTRDISLPDAVLDLVDNALDGVLRLAGADADYSDYYVKIEFGEEEFFIADNCGGLPREVAVEYAFKMGRDAGDDRDASIETIGMYGIGMKRAMFKMGTTCSVTTHSHGGDHYRVVIDREWLESNDWSPLPLEDLDESERLAHPGVTVRVSDLHPGIKKTFTEAAFERDLVDSLGEHFSKFLERGFVVTVNGVRVRPVLVEVLLDVAEGGVRPYFVSTQVGATQVRVVMGLNERAQASPERSAGTRKTAVGWSVFCNDRAVLVGDTTRLTGWGESVPKYHDQFDILTGIVEFRAADAKNLPVTTTKRDLDASAEAWLVAKGHMRDAARKWITHTNRWKNDRERHREVFPRAQPASLREVARKFEAGNIVSLKTRVGSHVKTYDPTASLPIPPRRQKSVVRISFEESKRRVDALGETLFGSEWSAADVGAKCFDYAYREMVDE